MDFFSPGKYQRLFATAVSGSAAGGGNVACSLITSGVLFDTCKMVCIWQQTHTADLLMLLCRFMYFLDVCVKSVYVTIYVAIFCLILCLFTVRCRKKNAVVNIVHIKVCYNYQLQLCLSNVKSRIHSLNKCN